MIDLTGQRFTRLLVLSQAGKSSNGAVKWKCVCDCGKVSEVKGTSLRAGETKSCGCLGTENRIAARVEKFRKEARKGTHGDVIRKLCARNMGCSLKEAAEAIGKKNNIASVYFVQLLKKGIVIKAGVHHAYRYFIDEGDAKTYDADIKLKLEERKKESAIRRKAAQAERARQKRAVIAAAKPPKPPKEPKPPKMQKPKQPAKPKKATTALKPSGLTLSTKRQDQERKREHIKATIIWPEHVKVQKAPTPRDDRFTFTPPSKDWRGVISQDQQERWAA